MEKLIWTEAYRENRHERNPNFEDINNYLKDGWTIKQIIPLDQEYTFGLQVLVILQK